MQDLDFRALYRAFGAGLRTQREKVGLTQEQLGQKANLSRTTITNIEKGNQQVALHQIFALSSVLGLKPEALFIKSDYKPQWITQKIQEKVKDEDLLHWVDRLK